MSQQEEQVVKKEEEEVVSPISASVLVEQEEENIVTPSPKTSIRHDVSTEKLLKNDSLMMTTVVKGVPVENASVESSSIADGDNVKLSVCQRLHRWWHDPSTFPLLLICLVTSGLNADQQLLAPQLTVIGNEMGFFGSDVELYIGGYLNIGFFLIGGISTLLTGYFTDKVNRVKLFAWLVICGETACFCVLFVTNYPGLFICRSLTGISVAGTLPVIFSLISDLFSEKSRGKAIAAVQVTLGLGIGIGQFAAGIIGGAFGWRIPFVVVSLPTILFAIIFMWKIKDPIRGGKEMVGADGAAYEEKMTFQKLKLVLRSKTTVLIWFQGLPGSIPWGIMLTFFQDLLTTYFGIPINEATLISLGFGFGGLIGNLIGGFAADRLWQKKYEFVPLFMGVTTMIGTIPVYIVLNMPIQPWFIYAAIIVPVGILIGMTGTAIRALLINVSLPETRGSAFGIFTLFDDLGRAFGPLIVAALIKAVEATSPALSDVQTRITTYNYGLIGWFICGLILLAMMITVRRDVETVKRRVDFVLNGNNNNNNALLVTKGEP